MIGILFAFGALLFWGLGDFLIQRSVRRFGDWIALFYICAIGLIVFTPFVYKDVGALLADWPTLVLLVGSALVMLIFALVDFESLKRGKITVIAPIYSFELVVTALLAHFIARESLGWTQVILIVILVVGMFFLSVRSFKSLRSIRWERGVRLAVIAMLGMGTINFMVSMASRASNPFLINWILCVVIGLGTVIYITIARRWREVLRGWKEHPALVIAVSLVDNSAWLFYSYSILYIPIAIATGISESYVALAAVLGLVFNHEKIKRHQWMGLIVTVAAVIALAVITDGT